MQQRPKVDRNILETGIKQIQLQGRRLTDWENKFVESVETQLDAVGSLSDNQVEKLRANLC